jgi:hypothetical protein
VELHSSDVDIIDNPPQTDRCAQMFAPLWAFPLAMQWIAAADGVPKLDVAPSCKGAAQSMGGSDQKTWLQKCIESEHHTRDGLAQNWSTFAVGDRTFCLAAIKGFSPTYSELATCLEMRRDLQKPQRPVDIPTTRPR